MQNTAENGPKALLCHKLGGIEPTGFLKYCLDARSNADS